MSETYYTNLSYKTSDSDTIKKIREDKIAEANVRFKRFGVPSLLYALVCTIALHNAWGGIFSIFAAVATVCYTLYVAKAFEKKPGKFIYFNCIVTILLSVSTFLTGNDIIIFFNYCGILLLIPVNGIYLFADLNKVSVTEHIAVFISNLFLCLGYLGHPVSDLLSSKKKVETKDNTQITYIIIGICIALPIVFVIGILLASADSVFGNSFSFLTKLLDFDYLIVNAIGIVFIAVVTYFGSYMFAAHISSKDIAPRKGKLKEFEPIIAIIVTASISLMYVFFCGIQIFYLFLHAGTLPENYTYAEYAREGFFQLLCVCVFNIIIVLICNEFFRDSKLLSCINVIVSVCTFIMIASSAYRMLMYIGEYGLTATRILALWFLVPVALIMAGLMIQIYFKQFNLFKYSVIVVSICYLVLSFSHFDYFIAYYNFNMYDKEKIQKDFDSSFSRYVDLDYIDILSTDAAPVIADHFEEMVTYLGSEEEWSLNYKLWAHTYYKESDSFEYNKIGIRNFNLSHYIAQNLFKDKTEYMK